jgi:hypothetical protein
MHKNVSKFLQSVVVFPVLATNLAVAPVAASVGSPTAAVIFPGQNRPLASVIADNQQNDHDVKVQKVEAYFAKYDLPLQANAEKLVSAAEENDLPPYLIAAVGKIESTGGKFACRNNKANAFGYGSCKTVKFDSVDEAIDTVATTLAAKRPKTAAFYDGKSIEERLRIYNGNANPEYVRKIMYVMDQMDKQEVASTDSAVQA